jgi:aryl-phospho-beta-D-glucosidase BglC (GH1 family)
MFGKYVIASICTILFFTLIDTKSVECFQRHEQNHAPIYKGHNLSRLRGVMISPAVTKLDLRDLGEKWNANLVRWQLNWTDKSANKKSLQEYDEWLEKELVHLDNLLPICKETGLMVVIDLHTTPGDRSNDKENLIFKEKKYQQKFIDVWRKIAQRYQDNDAVWGYDLANEPVERGTSANLHTWQSLADLAAKKIREIDPDRAIIVEPGDWGNPEGLKNFKPLSVQGVVYSVHMYHPHKFTHQGVDTTRASNLLYPGIIDGKFWDKNQLRQALKPVIDFQNIHNVHIYIGEFSAIRWAPVDSAYRYLKDAIEIFEENNWDWSYHAFREWNGWSVEHDENKANNEPSKRLTNRQRLLEEAFRTNSKPRIAK